MFQMRWLWRNIDLKFRRLLIFGCCLSAITLSMTLINPVLSSRLIDDVIGGGQKNLLFPLLGAMLGVTALRLGLRYLMIVCLEQASQNACANLRHRLFENLQFQEMAFFNRNRTGDLMTRLSGDLDWCRHFLAFLSYQIIDSVFAFTSALVLFFIIDWRLTLVMLLVTPVLLLTTRTHSKRIRPLFGAMRERLSEMNTAAQENISGNRVVRAFAREEYEKERFRERNAAFRDAHLAINRQWLKFFPFLEMLANSMSLVALFVGALFMILGDSMTFGELNIFISLSWALVNPMKNVGTLVNDIQRVNASAQKVMEIYYARPLIIDKNDAVPHPAPKGRIEFDRVSFAFQSKTVLEDITFTLEAGQTLAIMGPTGSGKTVLVQLLARLYEVKSGAIRIDGDDVRKWHLHELRRTVASATQEVFLFSDTAEGNIAFGNQELTVQEVIDFAKASDADEFLSVMPEGYDTIIGERGVGLSGGQRQRVALARALAMRSAVLVLDDTTSALDTQTEQYIQEQLRRLTCTKIIIAQRISSVMDADLILVLDGGRIAERGTHEQLLRGGGYYTETYSLQNDIPLEALLCNAEGGRS